MTTMMMHEQPTERQEEEAALWASRLRSGDLNAADRAALDAWLGADPQHRWVLGRYRELTAQLDAGLSAAAMNSTEITRTQTFARRRSWRRAAGVLGLAAAAVLVVALLRNRPEELKTKTAERHVAALPDGSQVELNAQTALAVDFKANERRVRLLRGEALFTVSKDAARPFIVETSRGAVRVTGTVFNVRETAGKDVEVTVLEGTVRLRATSAAVGDEAVAVGHQAVMADAAITVHEVPADEASDVVAWRQGQAIFEDTRLGEAVERFAAYQSRPLAIEPAAADLRIGGRYRLSDLDGFLQTVERVLPVRVTHEADGGVRIVFRQPPAR